MTTAIAMLHFHVSQCDAIVIETGLGGRLDSTNVLWPTVSAITTIGMDHQNLLGDTLAAIAREKAGIIKQSVPVVCGVTESEPWEVIREIAAEKSAVMIRPGDDFAVECRPSKKWGVDIYYQSIDAAQPASRDVHPTAIRASLPIDGVHQGQNAGLAIAICETLRGGVSGDLAGNTIERPLTITDGAIRTGLAALPTVGRIERFELTDGTIGIVDTAHNEDSIDALCHCVRGRFAGHAISVVFGTSHDKDPAVMLPQLCEIADTLVLTQFSGNPRFKPAEELVETVPTDFGGDVLVEPNSALACELALQSAPQLSDSPTNSPRP